MKKLLLAAAIAVAPIVTRAADPVTSLQIDQIQHITTTTGKIIPRTILMAQVGSTVCLHLPDGTEYKGIIIRREEALKEFVKIYGEVVNREGQCGFGLFISNEGKLEGAIVCRDTEKTYVVEYDEDIKGFVFKFRKSEKPLAIN